MYTKAENNLSAIELARKCLAATTKQLEPLLIYQFENDFDAHDDELQDRLEAQFEEEWKKAVAELERAFGIGATATSHEETRYVPLCGVGGACSWQIGETRLYIAYAHEDRETPYLLVVGTLL